MAGDSRVSRSFVGGACAAGGVAHTVFLVGGAGCIERRRGLGCCGQDQPPYQGCAAPLRELGAGGVSCADPAPHPQVDIFGKELLLIPIHLEVHWSLVAVDVARRRITYFDSQRTLNRRCPKVGGAAGGRGQGGGVPAQPLGVLVCPALAGGEGWEGPGTEGAGPREKVRTRASRGCGGGA